MDDGPQDEVLFDEDTERSWRAYLGEFRETVWPVMQEYGFTSFDAAFQSWILNRTGNSIDALLEHLTDAD